jgi:subtilisin family serine protease
MLLLLALLCPFAGASGANQRNSQSPADYRPDYILVQPKTEISRERLAAFHSSHGCQFLRSFSRIKGLQFLQIPSGRGVPELIASYKASGLFEFAEPDYIGHIFANPNDGLYLNGSQWGLRNDGSNGGTAHADINAPDGWDVLASASNITAAVIDTGTRYSHEDLAANIWTSPIDDSHGTNAVDGNANPYADLINGHGTMVAGVLGGVGNNGKGIAGVVWKIQMMVCKSFNSSGTGNISDTIACIDYAIANGARIINASFGFNPDSLALSNAIVSARNAGVIVVAACGNSSTNVDVSPTYPACYPLDNVVSVAATDRNDLLASFSNYGSTNVHLGAPGAQIWSTFSFTDGYYNSDSGTSFSAPFTAGVLALVMAKFPAETHQQLISRLLNGTDPLPSLAGKCVTGGRLNLRKALSPPIRLSVSGFPALKVTVSAGPNRSCVLQKSHDLVHWTAVATNTTSSAGTFSFFDRARHDRGFYRVVSNP